jgi:hypothetical protein
MERLYLFSTVGASADRKIEDRKTGLGMDGMLMPGRESCFCVFFANHLLAHYLLAIGFQVLPLVFKSLTPVALRDAMHHNAG